VDRRAFIAALATSLVAAPRAVLAQPSLPGDLVGLRHDHDRGEKDPLLAGHRRPLRRPHVDRKSGVSGITGSNPCPNTWSTVLCKVSGHG